MAPHSSTLAWKIPWMEEPGALQSMGSQRVGHDWVISLSCIGEGNGDPLQCSCLENPRDGGTSWAAIYGVTQSRTRLKQLSSSSSRSPYTYCGHGYRTPLWSCSWWKKEPEVRTNLESQQIKHLMNTYCIHPQYTMFTVNGLKNTGHGLCLTKNF